MPDLERLEKVRMQARVEWALERGREETGERGDAAKGEKEEMQRERDSRKIVSSRVCRFS
jgi:hypothetical protein